MLYLVNISDRYECTMNLGSETFKSSKAFILDLVYHIYTLLYLPFNVFLIHLFTSQRL